MLSPTFAAIRSEKEDLATHSADNAPSELLVISDGPADTSTRRDIRELLDLCVAADHGRSGLVKRFSMEQWLNRECRALTCQLSAAAIFDLLQANTHGALPRSIGLASTDE
jgi:hypothetical protein